MEYTEHDNTQAAILEFRNAIKIDPKFAEARYQLGLAYLKTGNGKQALGQLDRAATLDPTNIDALLKSAELYFLGKNTKESRQRVEKILSIDDKTSDAYSLLANIELNENNFEASLKAIKEAIQLRPKQSRYYLIQAHIFSAMKNYEAAEESILQALALEPNNSTNYNALVAFYVGTHKLEQAEAALRKMIATFPDLPEPHVTLARLYMSQGEKAEAEKSLKEAISTKPESSDLYIVLANFYRKNRQQQKAEESYQLALANSTKKEDIQAMLADLHAETGKIQLAQQEVTAILNKNADHPLANLVHAKLLLHEKKYSEATTISEKLVRDFPRWGEAYYLQAVALLGKGQALLSLTAVNQALQFSPNNAKARTLLAQLLYLKRDYKPAIQEAIKSLRLQENNLQAVIILGKSMLNSGQTDKALAIFTDIGKQVPDNYIIIYNQALAYLAQKNITKAINSLEHALTIKPEYYPALTTITAILLKQNKSDQAIARVREQQAKCPKDPQYLTLLASLLANDKNSQEEALTLFRKAQEIAPDSPQLFVMTARLLAQMHKTEAAIAEYHDLLQKTPDYTQGWMALGTLLETTGDKTGAKEAYQKALAVNPRYAPAANNLAWYFSQEKEPDLGNALRLALLAQEQMPDDPNVADTLGWIHYKRGSYKLALTQFSFALEKLPTNQTIHYHLALALQKVGQTEQAQKELVSLLQPGNDFPERQAAQQLLKNINN
ncbi:MAG: tetratricopeptide repeat protein [Desulfobulbaceae bacterium]|nr:tetratricopeptide repeat protein [Desulfobulbaceae bacterium]